MKMSEGTRKGSHRLVEVTSIIKNEMGEASRKGIKWFVEGDSKMKISERRRKEINRQVKRWPGV